MDPLDHPLTTLKYLTGSQQTVENFLKRSEYQTTLPAKILKEMRIPDHLTCLLRNLYAGQEATVRTRHGTTDWFQIGKRTSRLYIVTVYLTYMQSTCEMPGWMKHRLKSRLPGEISVTSDMQITPSLWQKVKKN